MTSADVRLKTVVLLLFIHCIVAPIVCVFAFGSCFGIQYLVSFLVL